MKINQKLCLQPSLVFQSRQPHLLPFYWFSCLPSILLCLSLYILYAWPAVSHADPSSVSVVESNEEANEESEAIVIDRRFVKAIELLNAQFADQDAIEISAHGNGFALTQTDSLLIEIQALDFYHLHDALRQAVATLSRREKAITERVNDDFSSMPLSAHELVALIKANNALAKTDDTALAKLTRSLVLLNFLSDDALDAMALVQANSWMLVALLEQSTGRRDDALLTLLAHNLGYEVFAAHTASKLPAHPLTHFYPADSDNIDSNVAHLFQLKKATHAGDLAAWRTHLQHLSQQPVHASHLLYGIKYIDAYQIRSKYLLLYPLIVYKDYQGNDDINALLFSDTELRLAIDDIDEISQYLVKDLSFSPRELIQQFEKQIQTEMRLTDAGLLHPDVLINYWQSRLLNAYYDIAVYLTEIDTNPLLMESLLTVFANNAHAETGLLLYRWFQVMTAKDDMYQQAVNQFILIADSPLSSVSILTTLLDRQYFLRPTLTDDYVAAKSTLFEKLDSRYHHQTKRFRINAQSGSPTAFSLKSHHYRLNQDVLIGLDYLGDAMLIQQALERENQPPMHAALLNLLFKYGAGDDASLATLKSLYKQQPSFYLLEKYVDVLISYKNSPQEAIDLLDDWITQRRDLSRRDYLKLISLIARAKAAAGDLDNAWRAIYPTLNYQYPPAMLVAADISLAQQKIEQTQNIIADYKRLHPTTLASLSYQLRSLLLQDNHQAAISLITNWYFPLNHRQFENYVVAAFENTPLKPAQEKALSQAIATSQLSITQKQQLQSMLSD